MRGYRLQKANRIADKQVKRVESEWYFQPDERTRGIFRKTQCTCSCWMCGHRRKWEGETVQEKRMTREGDDGY